MERPADTQPMSSSLAAIKVLVLTAADRLSRIVDALVRLLYRICSDEDDWEPEDRLASA